MRYLFLITLALIALPAQAQRVFRASSIDLEQNERIDILEARFASIESSINRLATTQERAVPVVAVTVATKPSPAAVATVRKSRIVPATYAPSQSHWTYQGDIRSHLATGHGTVNTAGMSRDEMESLHDSLHEGNVPRVQRTVSRSVQASGCPDGVCPTSSRSVQRSYQRTGIFRWRR